MKAMEEQRTQLGEQTFSQGKDWLNNKFKTAAKKFKRGKPKLKAENYDL